MPEHTPAPTPHRAIYGFAFFLLFLGAFVFYLFWALVPTHILADRLGLTYMPDKYFVLFVPPVIAFALTVFGFIVYPALNYAGTHQPDDERTLRDRHSISRCTWTSGVRRCCRNVAPTLANGGWAQPEHCDRHTQTASDDGDEPAHDVRFGPGALYCDCTAAEACLLRQRPERVAQLLRRQTVPSVYDLSASVVSARLFGDRSDSDDDS